MSDLPLRKLYSEHHASSRRPGFSILENERGDVIAELIGTGKKILDVGCRDGALTKHFVPGNNVLGIDIDDVSLDRAKKELGIETRSFDLNGEWEQVEEGSFDVVVAGEVIEHLYYPEKVFKKVKGKLKTGGLFIGSIPNAFNFKNRMRYAAGQKKNTPLADLTHINHFSKKELQLLLEKYFTEVKITGLGRWNTLARVFPSSCAFDLLFVCKKSE